VVAEVVDIAPPREFQKFGKPGKVANATIKDETGEIKLTLWNDEVDKIKKGQKIHIENGYVNEWQGEKQLTTGRFGKLEILGEGAETTDEATEDILLHDNPKDEGEKVLTKDEKEESDLLDNKESDEGEHILTEDEQEEAKLLEEKETDKGKHVLTKKEQEEEGLFHDEIEEEAVEDEEEDT
jgi:replication factor A1